MKNRILYLDCLRVAAAFAVVVIHTCSRTWDTMGMNTPHWELFCIYSGLAKWAVPVFVMISGAVFLEREIPAKVIFTRYVSRLALLYLVWSGLYAIAYGGTPQEILLNIIQGKYHLWYLPMLMGLYIAIPVLRQVVQTAGSTKYYLFICFCLTSAAPQLLDVAGDIWADAPVIQALNQLLSGVNSQLIMGYAAYFVAGYYLNRLEPSPQTKRVIYTLGLLGTIYVIGMTGIVSHVERLIATDYVAYFSVGIVFQSGAIFLWFKEHFNQESPWTKRLSALSGYTLGIYLVHPMVLVVMDKLLGVWGLSFWPGAAIPVTAVLAFFISLAMTAVGCRLPVLKQIFQ